MKPTRGHLAALLPALGLCLGLTLPTGSTAAPPTLAGSKTVNLCFEYEVSFIDGDVGDFAFDSMKAYGVRADITNRRTGERHTHWASPTTGCMAVTMRRADQYKIRMRSDAKLTQGRRIILRDDTTSPSRFGLTVASRVSPHQLGATKTYTWAPAPGGNYTENVSNIMAALTHSIRRRPGGQSNVTVRAYQESCGGGSCVREDPQGNNAVFLSSNNGSKRKFVIAHEVGHLLGRIADEGRKTKHSKYALEAGTNPGVSSCADGDDDLNHHFDSEEWATSAANEGFAHFYAAAVWNRADGSGCSYADYYDRDTLDCDAGSHFLRNTCYGSQTPPARSGSELDWMRFWWDVHDGCDVGFTAILRIWDRANPGNWSDASVVNRISSAINAELASKASVRSCVNEALTTNGIGS